MENNVEKSKFNMYSLGYVVADKDSMPADKQDGWYISVYPLEVLYNADGVLTDTEDQEVTTIDLGGGEHKVKVTKSKFLYAARWLGLGQSGRVTPPSVRAGELVLLFNFAGTEKYYWEALATEFARRKEDKIVCALNARNDLKGTNKHEDDSYYVAIDTFNKELKLHTTKNLGEANTYDFTFNTKDGIVILKDDKDNNLYWHSPNDTVTLYNNKNINVIAADKSSLEAERSMQGEEDGRILINSGKLLNVVIGSLEKGIETRHITYKRETFIGAGEFMKQPGEDKLEVGHKYEIKVGHEKPGEMNMDITEDLIVTINRDKKLTAGDNIIETAGTQIAFAAPRIDLN